MNFLLETLRLGVTNLWLHRLRSFLTSLGIIFGVGAVIIMVAIGEGSKRKALAAIERLGARNIIVQSVKPPETQSSLQGASFLIDYGIKRVDLRRIQESVPGLTRVVPMKRVGSSVSHGQYRAPPDVYVAGTEPALIDVLSLHVQRGRYLTQTDLDNKDNVAVIGAEIARRLFPLKEPLNETIRISASDNTQLFRVVGVLRPVGLAAGAGASLVGRDLNFDVHIPLQTATARYGDQNLRRTSGTQEGERMELSELYIEAASEDQVIAKARQIQRVMAYQHGDGADSDIKVIVPLELLEEAKRNKAMFNALMTAIAAIALLVGGIGIMNIMLASVTERTREIGIRRAMGATRYHIIAQFLVETTVLSAMGGVIGVAMGVGVTPILAMFATRFPESFGEMGTPVVSQWAIVLSFFVATSVGIVFGLYPAVKASKQDPIAALRHD